MATYQLLTAYGPWADSDIDTYATLVQTSTPSNSTQNFDWLDQYAGPTTGDATLTLYAAVKASQSGLSTVPVGAAILHDAGVTSPFYDHVPAFTDVSVTLDVPNDGEFHEFYVDLSTSLLPALAWGDGAARALQVSATLGNADTVAATRVVRVAEAWLVALTTDTVSVGVQPRRIFQRSL